ncbi:hypothetical protein ACTOWA_04875 [Herbaspirillum seropedicae]|uniref:hypothetical protein n=1 Tax=Herbaspirillum seropedicae TaxID=964 RepID=UPI00285DD163|nr:hypothetical protein [Herbaspirillum seropedicae]MDR6397280.1 hypothetical protein [Herbaspirillum seropedicae]
MSDTNPPLDKNDKKQNREPVRGHPQQQQGYIPNQEQAGAADHRQRQQDNAIGSNRSQAQQQSDAQELQDKASDNKHLALVKRPTDQS